MTHSFQPAMGAELDLTQESLRELKSNFDVQFITDERLNGDRHARGHYHITLIHSRTGEEKAVDILLSENSFARLVTVLRQHISYEFELYEWIDLDEPF